MVNELDALTSRYEGSGRALIERASEVACEAHRGQTRQSGEPYITHPIAVARYLADLGFDASSVAAALLHDVVEDCGVTTADLESQFGPDVAFLVDGVTKLKRINFRGSAKDRKTTDLQTESLKKMFFAMAEDLRVIIIKLADRLHNMQTLQYKEPSARTSKAMETLEIYVPIADRLGMGRMRGELEDLAFPYAYPEDYAWLKRSVKGKYEDRLRYIQRAAPVVKRHLTRAGIEVLDIHARAKRMWSLYRKLNRYDMDADKVMDLVALRVIVPDIKDCYEALGVIHANYKPLPGRVKDYIALPKPNGYRSLHTTVFCEKGRIAEIQIRTAQMHDHAENGVAAHWSYTDSGKRAVIAKESELEWINQLKSVLKGIKTSAGMADLKIDFFKNRIFALTPQGDVKDLPEGATPVDFAYAVHSELGHRTVGALVNDKLVPLNYALQSGDVVQLQKGKEARPSKDWLRIVKTNLASKHIISWFKKNDPRMAIADGRNLLNRELARAGLSLDKLNRRQINDLTSVMSVRSLDSLLTHLSMGTFDPVVVAKALGIRPPGPSPKIKKLKPKALVPSHFASLTIDGQRGLAYKLGRCCSPQAGSLVVGYLTVSRGVTVHARNCANITTASSHRLLAAAWA